MAGCRSGTSWGQHQGPGPSLPSEQLRPHFRKQPWPKGLWDNPGWGPATCSGLTAQAFLGTYRPPVVVARSALNPPRRAPSCRAERGLAEATGLAGLVRKGLSTSFLLIKKGRRGNRSHHQSFPRSGCQSRWLLQSGAGAWLRLAN